MDSWPECSLSVAADVDDNANAYFTDDQGHIQANDFRSTRHDPYNYNFAQSPSQVPTVEQQLLPPFLTYDDPNSQYLYGNTSNTMSPPFQGSVTFDTLEQERPCQFDFPLTRRPDQDERCARNAQRRQHDRIVRGGLKAAETRLDSALRNASMKKPASKIERLHYAASCIERLTAENNQLREQRKNHANQTGRNPHAEHNNGTTTLRSRSPLNRNVTPGGNMP